MAEEPQGEWAKESESIVQPSPSDMTEEPLSDGAQPSQEKFSTLRDKVLKSRNDTGTVAEALGRRNFLLALFWIALLALAFTFEQLKTRWEYLTVEAKNKRTKDLNLSQQQEVTTSSGLRYVDLKIGAGPIPRAGDLLLLEYTIKLLDGTKIISSKDRGHKALGFKFGAGAKQSELIPEGLMEGISTMHKGGKRRLIIPPNLGFGNKPVFFATSSVEPNSTLVYEVELVKVSMAPS